MFCYEMPEVLKQQISTRCLALLDTSKDYIKKESSLKLRMSNLTFKSRSISPIYSANECLRVLPDEALNKNKLTKASSTSKINVGDERFTRTFEYFKAPGELGRQKKGNLVQKNDNYGVLSGNGHSLLRASQQEVKNLRESEVAALGRCRKSLYVLQM